MSEYSVALEARLATLRFMASPIGSALFEEDVQRGKRVGAAIRAAAMRPLAEGEAFYWSPQICDLVQTSSESMPDWTLTREAVPVGAGFFWLGRPQTALAAPNSGNSIMAFGWYPIEATDERGRTGLQVQTYHCNDAIRPYSPCWPGSTFTWLLDMSLSEALGWVDTKLRRLPNDDDDGDETPPRPEHMRAKLKWFAAALAFLQQQILTTSSQRPDRATRRRWAASLTPESTIRVVELRRKRHDEPREPSEPVEWTCQWIVRGHWRKQWYPSLQRNQPIWILPYVKGPEDAPLKTPRPTVFAVVR